MNRFHFRLTAALCVLIGTSCAERQTEDSPPTSNMESEAKTMRLVSSAFEEGQTIDVQYTAEGSDVSPPLSWTDVPEGTRSFALICDDPDAPSPRKPAAEPWVHWVIYNIPPDQTDLPTGIEREAQPSQVPGAEQGRNSWSTDNVGYRGPEPPVGSGAHRYVFKVYALDTMLELPAGATKSQLLGAMKSHVLGQGQLTGTFER